MNGVLYFRCPNMKTKSSGDTNWLATDLYKTLLFHGGHQVCDWNRSAKLKARLKKIDMTDTIYTVISSVLHKNNRYLY